MMSEPKQPWKTGKHARQGDIMLIKLAELPEQAKPQDNKDRVVLAWGEATGHAHAIPTTHAAAYEWQGDTLVKVKPGAQLVHEEHTAIPLTRGVYQLRRQVEYTPERLRQVAD